MEWRKRRVRGRKEIVSEVFFVLIINLSASEQGTPTKMRIAEAILIINERKMAARRVANRARQKERLSIKYQEQKESLRIKRLNPSERDQAKRTQRVRRTLGLPPETKAEFIEKTCLCGRKFKVLTHHKGVKRRKCRVCKPY